MFLFYIGIIAFVLFNGVVSKDAVESVKITKWEYCEGCKETVSLFSQVSAAELNKMQKDGKSAKSVLAVQDLVAGICDHKSLNQFNRFIQLTCIKIMEEHQLPFLKQFEGSVSSTSVTHNSVVLEQKRKVSCYNHFMISIYTQSFFSQTDLCG